MLEEIDEDKTRVFSVSRIIKGIEKSSKLHSLLPESLLKSVPEPSSLIASIDLIEFIQDLTQDSNQIKQLEF